MQTKATSCRPHSVAKSTQTGFLTVFLYNLFFVFVSRGSLNLRSFWSRKAGPKKPL